MSQKAKQAIKEIQNTLRKSSVKSFLIEKNNTSHLLIQGDSGKILNEFPLGKIDLILTDPPYNRGLDYGKFNDNKNWPEYYRWVKGQLVEYPRVLKETGSIYLLSYPEINARLLPFLEDELGLKYRSWITWHYPSNIGHSKKNFTRSQRSFLYFVKSEEYIFNQKEILQPYKNPTAPVIRERLKQGHFGRPSYDFIETNDLFEINNGYDVIKMHLLKNNSPERYRNLQSKFQVYTKEELKFKDHPCQLPSKLLEVLIKVSSKKQGIILDTFAGTFTTSLAALKLGRNSIGIELNQRYFNFGKSRLMKHV